jgi:hypothetical protein
MKCASFICKNPRCYKSDRGERQWLDDGFACDRVGECEGLAIKAGLVDPEPTPFWRDHVFLGKSALILLSAFLIVAAVVPTFWWKTRDQGRGGDLGAGTGNVVMPPSPVPPAPGGGRGSVVIPPPPVPPAPAVPDAVIRKEVGDLMTLAYELRRMNAALASREKISGVTLQGMKEMTGAQRSADEVVREMKRRVGHVEAYQNSIPDLTRRSAAKAAAYYQQLNDLAKLPSDRVERLLSGIRAEVLAESRENPDDVRIDAAPWRAEVAGLVINHFQKCKSGVAITLDQVMQDYRKGA